MAGTWIECSSIYPDYSIVLVVTDSPELFNPDFDSDSEPPQDIFSSIDHVNSGLESRIGSDKHKTGGGTDLAISTRNFFSSKRPGPIIVDKQPKKHRNQPSPFQGTGTASPDTPRSHGSVSKSCSRARIEMPEPNRRVEKASSHAVINTPRSCKQVGTPNSHVHPDISGFRKDVDMPHSPVQIGDIDVTNQHRQITPHTFT